MRNTEINLSKTRVLAPGTYVRILLNSADSVFSKSFKPIFSPEIFKIVKVKKGIPNIYYLKDLDGEPIKGTLYRRELKETSLPDYYIIEKILKTRKKNNQKQFFVKWRGYPDKFNSWVGENQLKK